MRKANNKTATTMFADPQNLEQETPYAVPAQESVHSREGDHAVEPTIGRYLIAPCPTELHRPGATDRLDAMDLLSLLEADPDVDVVEAVWPSRQDGLAGLAVPRPMCPPIAIVNMNHEYARTLGASPQIIIEPDQPLMYPSTAGVTATTDPALAVPTAESAQLTIRVRGTDGSCPPKTHVWAQGIATPIVHTVTDDDGRATLLLACDSPSTLRALYIRPTAGYWPTRLDYPNLSDDGRECLIEVRPLTDSFPGFPDKGTTTWGQHAMRVHELPPTHRGNGITIAILDSGIDAAHPDLKHALYAGKDFTHTDTPLWEYDATGNGTACAGVISAADNGTGVTGIATGTRLQALKLYPGGRTSDLLKALDWCLTHDTDLAQINLAYPMPSQLSALKIFDLHAAGVATIAPTGDTTSSLAFPAAVPGVLAITALAHIDPTCPIPHSGWPTTEPLYTPTFVPAVPGADLAAPGTNILTTAGDASYTTASGTALAAAHITALSALALAHHPTLRTQARTSTRLHQLHSVLTASGTPVLSSCPTGRGLPDAPTALALSSPSRPVNGAC
ncbi:S8 family serine peptidase [Streptomyces yunnanensis]|uniref:Subtilase family protein n=1 Tax=Streptomyces yunnanensis TaxID=156453 RepID=A0A9X8R0K7_9ACTN|nr:S8 family serine peptidase [Streptomyces yunnanensis]SHN35325.1 Subtilase family protein [Streptomyces yunnanensis]